MTDKVVGRNVVVLRLLIVRLVIDEWYLISWVLNMLVRRHKRLLINSDSSLTCKLLIFNRQHVDMSLLLLREFDQTEIDLVWSQVTLINPRLKLCDF